MAIEELLHLSLAAGGLGLSTSRSSTHPDHEGNPVASRLATEVTRSSPSATWLASTREPHLKPSWRAA